MHCLIDMFVMMIPVAVASPSSIPINSSSRSMCRMDSVVVMFTICAPICAMVVPYDLPLKLGISLETGFRILVGLPPSSCVGVVTPLGVFGGGGGVVRSE